MAHTVLYHCSHGAPLPERPPSLDPTVVEFDFKPLPSLYFCEECDAIRCDRCATAEVSCWFCPNCLFEVTAASVRTEKNRCARSCFLCPECDHTLVVTGSDPSEDSLSDLRGAASSVGESPYYLCCAFCRWDSKEVGIRFDKPTGLAAQLQKREDDAPERHELDRLRDHFEPFLKAQQLATQHQPHQPHPSSSHASSARAAASAALSREVPGLSASSRYSSVLPSTRLSSARGHAATAAEPKDELAAYTARTSFRDKGKGRSSDVELMSDVATWDSTAPVSKRWTEAVSQPVFRSSLEPLRVPLRSKSTRRCPTCSHILVRPEQKAQSTRFKIKLMANVFLPQIELVRRSALNTSSRLTAAAAAAGRRTGSGGPRASVIGAAGAAGAKDGEEEALRPGRGYTFELSFANPLYEPITVRISAPPTSAGDPFTITLPAPTFTIAALAETWEYDDDEDDEDDGAAEAGDHAKRSRLSMGGTASSRTGRTGHGVLEKKANRTTVAVELAINKDFLGPVKSPLLVTYTYQADDQAGASATTADPAKASSVAEDKTFTFWTALSFGTVAARPAATGEGPRQSIVGAAKPA